MRRLAWAALIAGIAAASMWQHLDLVRVGYDLERLRDERTQLLGQHHALLIEQASLESLDRIETIAVRELGLRSPRPGQVVVVRRESPSLPGEIRVAQEGDLGFRP